VATILIVDDRRANRDYLAALLSAGGNRLLQAADGAEALATARAERPDLVIAEILMPTMDGFELVRQLRAGPIIAQTPLIFCTAHYHEREARALARTCGVSCVISKPSEPEVVLSAVAAALGLLPPAASSSATEEFDREHLRLLTDELSQKADELRATNGRLSALVDLNLQLGSELDLRRLVQSFGHAAREIIGARYSVTGILDAEGLRLQSLYASGIDAETAAQLGSPDPQAGVLRTVLREGRCVRVSNPGGDPAVLGFSSSRPPIRAWLGAPIASPTRVYGYVGLIDKLGSDEFSKEDERLAVILAAQVGRVYENGSRYADLLRHASDLEREVAAHEQMEKILPGRVREGLLVGEVGAAFPRCGTLSEMLQLCAQGLVRHLDVVLARIWTFNDIQSILELRASAGLYTHIDGSHSRIPIGESEIGRIAQERTPHLTNDVMTDPLVSDKEWAKREGIVSFAGYPLIVEERLVGVVGMFACQALGTATLDVAGAVAQQIALGIERELVTSERASGEALREREEHIRLLLDSTAEAIYGIDRRGRCTFANQASARFLGYVDPSQLLGRNMHSLVHHSRKDGTPYPVEECRIFRAFLQNQGSHIDDEVLWRADGSSFPAEYWSHPICRDGQAVGAVVTFLDITERRQLEDQFRRAQQRLRDVVASSPTVLFTLSVAEDQVQGISWTSENLREILGYPPEVAISPDWWVANVHPEDLERVKTQTNTDLFTRGHSTQEYRFRHIDGSYRWTRCDMRLIRDETGRPSEVVGARSDITERKRAEEEQFKLREQLQQAQKLESVSRLAGGVAHDFNNLLTVINGHSDLLLRDLAPDDPMHESVSEIGTAGKRAEALVRQLLLLSRKQVTQVSDVNLNDIVTEVEKMLARVIGEDIRLESVLSSSLGYGRADAGQVHQILMNLAINARDAMPGGGTLLIETANADLDDTYAERHPEVKPGPYVQLKVSDTGIGMPQDVMSHLFEPFFTTKNPGEGTGLGLATVYGIVKQSGGSIQVYSEPGIGTTFTIYLPRVDPGVKLQQEPEPEPAPQSLRGTETVLVVEDQEQLRKMAGRVLRSYGYRVLEAANPGEALLHCERYAGPIHLMVTDVVMPRLTGPELAGRVKPLRPSMEVLFMSGYSERAITDRLELGGSYLSKPFSPEALATKVRGVLGSPRPAGTVLVVDDESSIRSFLRKILTGVGYRVLEAKNGREAVLQIETSEVDMMITDLAMPEQEGIETINLLRRQRPRLKIIAISGRFGADLLHTAELLGADATLAKPIQPKTLLDTVALVMRV
jgi:PAS domain S-box-containing protein